MLDEEGTETRGCRSHWMGAAVGQSHGEIARFAHGANYIGHQFRGIGETPLCVKGGWCQLRQRDHLWTRATARDQYQRWRAFTLPNGAPENRKESLQALSLGCSTAPVDQWPSGRRRGDPASEREQAELPG